MIGQCLSNLLVIFLTNGTKWILIVTLALGLMATNPIAAQTTIDYDTNNNGLIEIRTLAQLNAIRWDLNGDGQVDNTANAADYRTAFPNPTSGMGCPSSGCTGYELMNNLDFDENDDGQITAIDADYWNGGRGWSSIAGNLSFTATFKGNGYTISNLFINTTGNAGLFGTLRESGIIEGLGLVDAQVTGQTITGSLVVTNQGMIRACYATGAVSSSARLPSSIGIGGLVGYNLGTITASYTIVTVSNSSTGGTGGLVGSNDGAIIASYAAGLVDKSLVTSGASMAAGLAGSGLHTVISTPRDSYWDTETTGQTASAGSSNTDGKTTVELQTPITYTGIYTNWNVDVDGDGNADNPWDFGSDTQYPVLRFANFDTAVQHGVQAPMDASLSALTLSAGLLNPRFSGAVTRYTAYVDDTVTITPTTSQAAITWTITPTDADPTADGHQVNPSRDDTTVTITVTASNRTTTRAYTVTVIEISPDIHGRNGLDGDDALIMYYVYTLGELLTGSESANANARAALLSGLSDTDTDENYRNLVRRATGWQQLGIAAGGDLNGDNVIDAKDALVMYYAYTFSHLLGNGQLNQGSQRLRAILLDNLVDDRITNPQDADYRHLLRRANQLSPP